MDTTTNGWISGPRAIVDRRKLERNTRRIIQKASKSGCRFRPHFKTHQSATIGEWMRGMGVSCISASSVDMAVYFNSHGWNDVSICIPFNPRKRREVEVLARTCHVHLLVDSVETARFLDREVDASLSAWLEVDVGSERTGVTIDQGKEIEQIVGTIEKSPHVQFEGILTHAGHVYRAKGREQILAVHADQLSKMRRFKEMILDGGASKCEISIGDTPIASVVEAFEDDVDEIRPGNFCFYDLTQARIGSCGLEDIALAIACPVISKKPRRGEVVIHGGSIHLSKEFLIDDDGKPCFGVPCLPAGDGWGEPIEDASVTGLSQEHGIIKMPGHVIDELRVGDLLFILPVHSCISANLHSRLYTTGGEPLDCFRY